MLGDGLACPPCNIGPRSTPNYAALAQAAVHSIPGGVQVFAGQRNEGFYVDLGATNRFGILGGDLAGFPNGRRVFDDVVSIELQAIAGVTFALVDSSFTPDAAAGELTEGLIPAPGRYQAAFPYLAPALDGFDNPPS